MPGVATSDPDTPTAAAGSSDALVHETKAVSPAPVLSTGKQRRELRHPPRNAGCASPIPLFRNQDPPRRSNIPMFGSVEEHFSYAVCESMGVRPHLSGVRVENAGPGPLSEWSAAVSRLDRRPELLGAGGERDLPYRKACRGWDWLVGRPWAGGCPTRTVMTPAAVRSEGSGTLLFF